MVNVEEDASENPGRMLQAFGSAASKPASYKHLSHGCDATRPIGEMNLILARPPRSWNNIVIRGRGEAPQRPRCRIESSSLLCRAGIVREDRENAVRKAAAVALAVSNPLPKLNTSLLMATISSARRYTERFIMGLRALQATQSSARTGED